jgi:aminopeptidase-like protein
MMHQLANADGAEMHGLAQRLFPLNRSITGEGVRQTLAIIRDYLPLLTANEVPSGTQCFDWIVPQEWQVDEAFIETPAGDRIADFSSNNLHLVGYSIPVDKEMRLAELDAHLHSLPDQPEAIPYVTSYYKENWGFCLPHVQRSALPEGTYRVVIRSRLFAGSLTYGELFLPGQTQEEVLISTYICHPSMANDQVSGPVVATFVAEALSRLEQRRLSYRFVFAPETIGAIAYLSRRCDHLRERVIAGFNVCCIGDDGDYSYLASRNGNTLADRIASHVLQHLFPEHKRYSFLERGSDERQYCSPGVDLPLCVLMRSKFGTYPEYHTSLDNLDLVTPSGLQGGYRLVSNCLDCLENDVTLKVATPCEPQLGKRGLYPNLSVRGNGVTVRERTNLLAYADGKSSLLDIAETIGVPVWKLYSHVDELLKHGLLISP